MVSFSIRSFGSWGEALDEAERDPTLSGVSVSALSDRGVRQKSRIPALSHSRFQYPLFRIVG